MGIFKQRSERINPEDLAKKAEHSLHRTRTLQPMVDATTNWLRDREDQNGFGEDFEFTLLKPRRAS